MDYTLRVRLQKTNIFYGPGVDELLRLVERTGSLQTAAAEMGMSYSKAWKIVRTAESELGYALLKRHTGGAGGGSSELTARGRDFSARYSGFREALGIAADGLFRQYFQEEGVDETDEKD